MSAQIISAINNGIARAIKISIDAGLGIYDTIDHVNNFMEALLFLRRIQNGYSVFILKTKKSTSQQTIEVHYKISFASQTYITRVKFNSPVTYKDIPSDLADSLGY